MCRFNFHALICSLSLVLSLGNSADAQPFPTYTEHSWTGGVGAQNWQDGANWDLADFPNDIVPDDTIYPTANLSVGLGGNLNVNVGTSPVTIAGLTLGGTSGVVDTEVSSGLGGQLNFKNHFSSDFTSPENDADFDNDERHVSGSDFLIWQQNFGTTNPELSETNYNDHGDADADNDVDGFDLVIWQEQYGLGFDPSKGNNAFLISGGVAGSVNHISAPIHLEDEPLDIQAVNPLVIDAGAVISNAAPDLTSSSRIDVIRGTVTINSDVVITNVDTTPDSGGTDIGLSASGEGAVLILNGTIRDANPNSPGTVRFGGGDGRVEIYGDNDLGPHFQRTGGGEILLGHDHALGVSSVAPFTPAHVGPLGTFISDNDNRTIPNKFTMQTNFNFAGDKSLTLTGEVTQTNNRAINNNIASPGKLILAGRINIWEDSEALQRRMEFTGTGTTLITGIIRDDPEFSGGDRQIVKSGAGSLIIDVGPGDNQHSGITKISRGNFHYANNDSLNTGAGKIVSTGGAIGVDMHPPAQTLATNLTFINRIDSASTGGLMLSSSDAATDLDFTSSPLSSVAEMSIAAPDAGLTYTGNITPANSTYAFGGGSGTLTLPNAQLSGANSVQVRDEGTVELLGDNTYTGATTVVHNLTGNYAPSLVVDDLSDGGSPSSIGSATSDASNLLIQGATLKYVGAGDSTDRLFTIGTGGATIDSSGTGGIVFSSVGALGIDDAESRTGSLNGTDQPLAGVGPFPTGVYNLGDTSDIVTGMTVSDPDPGTVFFGSCGSAGENCIPEGTLVTSVRDDGFVVNLDNGIGFLAKLNTNIVFGTVERTLTLSGTNADDNTLNSAISDSPMGGVVSVDKIDSGKWILSGSNSYSGDTTVEQGILSLTSDFLADDSDVYLSMAGLLDLDYSGSDSIGNLFLDGTAAEAGLWGAPGNIAATFTSSLLSGDGLLNVAGTQLSGALGAVPEPNAIVLTAMAMLLFTGCSRRPSQCS